ncbi:type VI secretion system baseplate subunit TssF [Paraburkholderia terricola]|uniref:Type VI secretion system protein ImpG n=1 Tax=Paraburkholderia terricola TaxID=169427 RepID=A0ABU1M1K1_9BURK|nr:type VI secretion system baseplate subunit TssF [Paraburkholderia terricola]MDR6412610.1 type VI secretion system protein ImpG [Paraburkholderia terricola]MDR6485030.1 type VI secretion system protein ImpG [Paraburkholderia terricola]
MDERFLDYYNRELTYLRQLGAEFALQFPKIAGRLGMHGVDVADPYVERLLEGFCFLTARVQMKMDAEFPRFSQRLLDVVYPNALAPMPAMAIVQMTPDQNEGSLVRGFAVPAGTALQAKVASGEVTPCEFRTAHDLVLWPLAVSQVRMTGVPVDLPSGALRHGARAALRIRIEVTAGALANQLPLDQLTFYLSGPESQAARLVELVTAHVAGVVVHAPGDAARNAVVLDADAIAHEGFHPSQAMLPNDGRMFEGYRLLQEYFAFPARYLFFSVSGLRRALAQCGGNAFELTLLLDRDDAALASEIDTRHLALNCTPAVNLFPRRTDRIPVTPRTHEYHLVVDRVRPLDHEVYAVTRVTGHRIGDAGDCDFHPFYASNGVDSGGSGAYYSIRREGRVASAQMRANGARTSYPGTEVFVSLVDRQQAPFDERVRQLSADTLCTNRDLPLLLPRGAASDFTPKISAPLEHIKVLRGPSRPRPPLAQDAAAWRLISHLGLNYQPLTDIDDEAGARALRELLGLYAQQGDAATRKQTGALQRLACEPVYRRLPECGPIVFGRGVRVTLTVDEQAFAGDSPYLIGAVLEQFFARHASINAFTEFALHSVQRGEFAQWPARVGRRPAI